MPINIPVDFTGVEARASVKVPEGDYAAKVVKLEQKNSSQKKTPGLYVTFEGLSGALKGKRIQDRHWLTKDSLWTLRNMLEAMGFQVPAGQMNLKEQMLKGKKVGLTIIDGEEYKSKVRSEIGDYLPFDMVGQVATGNEDVFGGEDEDDEEDDGLGGLGTDEEEDEDETEIEEGDEETEVEEEEAEEEAEEEDDNFSFGEDDEEEEAEDEETPLSFSRTDVETAKGKELLPYVKEAQDAGWDLGLGKGAKVADVKAALLAVLPEEDEEEMEDFSLEDV